MPPASLLKSLSINAYTFSELLLQTAIAILPIPSGNPFFIFSQCSPPSVDLYRPLPGPPLITCQGLRPCSHMAAYKMEGLFMSIDNSEQPVISFTNKTFFQVTPPSVDL